MSQATVARQRNITPKPRKIVTCMEKQEGRAAVGWGLNGRWVGLGGFREGSTRVRVGWAGRAGLLGVVLRVRSLPGPRIVGS